MGRIGIKYLMLDPKTYDIVGKTTSNAIKKDLKLNTEQLRYFVDRGDLYQGCILIEDEAPTKKRNMQGETNMAAKTNKCTQSTFEFMMDRIREQMDVISNPDLSQEELDTEIKRSDAISRLSHEANAWINTGLKASRLTGDDTFATNIMLENK